MKKNLITPIAAMAITASMLFGCASSNENMDATATDSTTMSETQTMGGDMQNSTTTTTSDISATNTTTDMAGSSSAATTDMSSDMNYTTMFNDISNTKAYDILALAKTNPHLSTFVQLMETSGLAKGLERSGASFTVFAPTNEAFQSLSKETYDNLTDPQHKAELVKILQAHVLPNKVMSSQFNETQRIETADGNYIAISTNTRVGSNAPVTVGGATIVKPDVEASNGVLHVVNAVIMPEENNTPGGIIRQ
ncbi:fasciclin domain-containing protein [Pontibacter chitinilyticus]|uniref:fasciclin domain-containing protein n=1 Tax=Pontibacter chitinilyticus TaxID=2674989 RepID=UPI00321BD361